MFPKDNQSVRRKDAGALLFLLIPITGGLAGCTPSLNKELVVRSVNPSTPANERALEYYKEVEWPLNVTSGERPQLGVALSGGGMRSAVFSLGALSGLHELGLFPQQTDMLSTVSGGGYIASWFYAQQMLEPTLGATELLNPEGSAQEALMDNAKLIQWRHTPGAIPVLLSNWLIGIPVNFVLNGVWGLRSNTSWVSSFYERRLRSVFLSSPNGESESLHWHSIDEFVRGRSGEGADRRLPNLIMNATVDLGVGNSLEEQSGYNTIYGFTPQRFGSDGLGYFCVDGAPSAECCTRHYEMREELAPLETAVVTSGAAFDSSHLDSVAPGVVERKIVSALNSDLGRWYANPSVAGTNCWLKIFPFIHWTNPRWYRKDIDGCRILLADGGHSENLGAYSLVRRLPAAIVIVDAEQDRPRRNKQGELEERPRQRFRSYKQLRKMLLEDLNLTLSIPGIDDGDGENGPIFAGHIFSVPSADPSRESDLSTKSEDPIRVVYVKLPSPDDVAEACGGPLPRYPCTVCDFAKDHPVFPQHSTFGDQSFDSGQFRAYRDLGLEIFRNGGDSIRGHLGF